MSCEMNAKVLVMAHLFKVKKKIKRASCLNRVKKINQANVSISAKNDCNIFIKN